MQNKQEARNKVEIELKVSGAGLGAGLLLVGIYYLTKLLHIDFIWPYFGLVFLLFYLSILLFIMLKGIYSFLKDVWVGFFKKEEDIKADNDKFLERLLR